MNIPFDVAKSRIQGPQPEPGVIKYRACFQTLGLVYREEGLVQLTVNLSSLSLVYLSLLIRPDSRGVYSASGQVGYPSRCRVLAMVKL